MKDATETTTSAAAAAVVLGELNYASTVGDPVEILPSLDSSHSHTNRPRVAQSARFVVSTAPNAEGGGGRRGGHLVLCWVDPRGELHHHYTYRDGNVDHDEMTYTGDAFVVYVVSKPDDADSSSSPTPPKKPRYSSDLTNNPELYSVLFSYRLRGRLPHDDEGRIDGRAHCVRYSVGEGRCGTTRRSTTGDGATCTCSATSIHVGDDEYRITIEPPPAEVKNGVGETTTSRLRRLPPPSEPWEVRYEFLCPPLPSSPGWNPSTHTFYVWGDVDFDDYGASHKHGVPKNRRGVHDCVMNQIVPQVMIGNCLSSNDDEYRPSWKCFDRWVIQAQYYWLAGRGGGKNGDDDEDDDRAMCGPLHQVEPGEVIRTRICYDPTGGTVTASIFVVERGGHDTEKKVGRETKDVGGWPSSSESSTRRSEIVIPRPFPHDPDMFHNWTDFFERCMDAERRGVKGGGGREATPPRRLLPDSPPTDLCRRFFLPCCRRGGGKRHDESPPPPRGGVVLDGKKHEKRRIAEEIGPLYRPLLNVEYKGRVDIATLRSVCPFVVRGARIPGLDADDDGSSTSRWRVGLESPRTGSVDVLQDVDGRDALRVEEAALLGTTA